jgi:chromosome segregation protein
VFLKTLTIKGFKSFADTTELELEPGVTVVVGPNGSGKSNVVDAIAWVLGAQAPKSIRSQKMDDVIFAGTAKRAALGRAEVSLTIDNSSGMLPIEFNEVTITRVLFRTGDSEYSINGAPCRLLDIQDLLSDAGVGKQQHVIISQGQIDAVLNARPEERRLIIEEAAGVLKYRRRKEKAERRLKATEANLTRCQDLLREVRRQLRPLERQADAARRHGSLISELNELRIHTAGRELQSMTRKLEEANAQLVELAATESDIKAALATLDVQVLDAEQRLSAQGADDLGDDLAAFEALRERTRGLSAVVSERLRSIEAARNEAADETVIATLEAEAGELARQLVEVGAESTRLEPLTAGFEAEAAELAAKKTAFTEEHGDGPVATASTLNEVKAQIASLTEASGRGEKSVADLDRRLAELRNRGEQLRSREEDLATTIARTGDAHGALERACTEAASWVTSAAAKRKVARDAATSAASEAQSWQARAEALDQALENARSAAGIEKVADLEGVRGTLLDLVAIDDGFDAAVEAALGEALAAIVTDSPSRARACLDALQSADLGGAVLAIADAGEPAIRAFPIPGRSNALGSDSAGPAAGSPVRNHVTGREPEVEPLLDRLLAGVVVVDGTWGEGLDIALANPELTVVTTGGERFSPSGWRVGASTAGATGAALEEARARAEAAAESNTSASQALRVAEAEFEEATTQEAAARKALDANQRERELASRDHAGLDEQLLRVDTEGEELVNQRVELMSSFESDKVRLEELNRTLPGLIAAEADHEDIVRRWRTERDALEVATRDLANARRDHDLACAAIAEREQVLTARSADVKTALDRNVSKRDEAAQRRRVLDRRFDATERLASMLEDHGVVIGERLDDLRAQRQAQTEAAGAIANELDALRRERMGRERALEETRERSRRAELSLSETQMRMEAAVEVLRRDLDCDPERAMKTDPPELAEGVTPAARLRELERELRIMGPINPLALEEYDALQERHEFLRAQLDDVKNSRRELNKVIKSIDVEIVDVFVGAFADVSQNFEALFETLFPGGRGRLVLTDPNNPLETGIEIQARPSGKNVRKLSLLSGGERSLTALAYLFAIFRSRPSPFYVMDEVEAALDDVNLHRFLGLVAEFRDEAQLIIVSHQKRTMEAGDVLYGVTMKQGGSSQVLSEKVGVGT